MSDAWSWDQMLGEFRGLGGVAENIGLRQGPLGRGLFALDPAKPVEIHTPPNLLIATDDILFDDGVLRLGNNAAIGGRERDFFERYQAAFSWGGRPGRLRDFRGDARRLAASRAWIADDRLHVGFGF